MEAKSVAGEVVLPAGKKLAARKKGTRRSVGDGEKLVDRLKSGVKTDAADSSSSSSSNNKLQKKKRKRKRASERFSRVKKSSSTTTATSTKKPHRHHQLGGRRMIVTTTNHHDIDEVKTELIDDDAATTTTTTTTTTNNTPASEHNYQRRVTFAPTLTLYHAEEGSSSGSTHRVKKEEVIENPDLLVDIGEDYGGLTMEEGFENQGIQFAIADIPFEEMYFEESKPFVATQQQSLDPLGVVVEHQQQQQQNNAIVVSRKVVNTQMMHGRVSSKRKSKDIDAPIVAPEPPKILSVSKQTLRKISEVIYKWYEIHFENGIPLTKLQILEKAKEVARRFFTVSVDTIYNTRWYDTWQQHHQLYKPLFGAEREAANEPMSQYYKKTFERRMEMQNYQTHQIFCAQMFHVNYKSMPRKPTFLGCTGESSVDARNKSDGLTIMACSNVDGTLKLPLLVIGKYPESTTFKNISPYLKPVTYLYHKSALLNGKMLDWWFKTIFVEIVKKFLVANKLPVKALLFFERYKSFGQVKKICDGEIMVEYLDPEIARAVHPMEVGIMDQIKRRYKMNLLKSLLCIQNFGVSIDDFLGSITLRQALFQLKDAWDLVSNENIFKCWSKLLPQYFFQGVDTALTNDVTFEEVLNNVKKIDGYEWIDEEAVKNWINSYEDPPDIPKFEELVQMVKNCNLQEINLPPEEEALISKPEAFYAVDTLLQFLQENFLVGPSSIDALKKVKYAIMDYTITDNAEKT